MADPPYKAAFTPDAALGELRNEVRKGWKDGALVDAFQNVMTRIPAVHIGHISAASLFGRLVFRQALGSTQPAGRVVQVGLAGGMAHVTAMKTVKPEVSVAVSWWGNIRELREVLALAESGRVTPIPPEFRISRPA